jgi:hypothetical protein
MLSHKLAINAKLPFMLIVVMLSVIMLSVVAPSLSFVAFHSTSSIQT